MRALAGLLSTFVLVPSAAVSRLGESSRVMTTAVRFVAPSWCHGLDCPAFDSVSSGSSLYEVRRYAPSVWVATVVTGPAYDKAVNTGFMALFGYIGGANEASEKIEMTTPVLVDVSPGPGPTCGSNFTVAFYATEGAVPPSPTNPALFVRHVPERLVYVTSYGGWASESTVLAKASELASALAADGKEFQDGIFLTASYDSPFRLLGRHNEVWLLAK